MRDGRSESRRDEGQRKLLPECLGRGSPIPDYSKERKRDREETEIWREG
jgi:hypothetical protein